MPAFLQLGHNSRNLWGEEGLESFGGVVLSPVNENLIELSETVSRVRTIQNGTVVFDPQLYVPASQRLKLTSQAYFPQDFETADLSSLDWWLDRADRINAVASDLGVDVVVSPSSIPRVYDDSYYAMQSEIARQQVAMSESSPMGVYQSVIVDYSVIATPGAAERIASILTGTEVHGYYLVVVSPIEPRLELAADRSLLGILRLIRALSDRGRRVLVSHCSSDMLLYKIAGASDVATGKFFNLRRFTTSRYDEEAGGGGQLGYWFEQNLLAFLRLADIQRLQARGRGDFLGGGHSTNVWSERLLADLSVNPASPGVATGWRQYLSWFAQTVAELERNTDPIRYVRSMLIDAEHRWSQLEDEDLLFDERRNSGGWIRPWRQAVADLHR